MGKPSDPTEAGSVCEKVDVEYEMQSNFVSRHDKDISANES